MPYKNRAEQNAYQRNWVAERRRLWFRNKVCANCGTKEHLELDHIDPTQKVDHRIWSWSWARIIAETAKCQVLCQSCHIEKTMKERDAGLVHGTNNGYEYYKCRCESCRKAHNENVNEWRWKTGRRTRLLQQIIEPNEDALQIVEPKTLTNEAGSAY